MICLFIEGLKFPILTGPQSKYRIFRNSTQKKCTSREHLKWIASEQFAIYWRISIHIWKSIRCIFVNSSLFVCKLVLPRTVQSELLANNQRIYGDQITVFIRVCCEYSANMSCCEHSANKSAANTQRTCLTVNTQRTSLQRILSEHVLLWTIGEQVCSEYSANMTCRDHSANKSAANTQRTCLAAIT